MVHLCTGGCGWSTTTGPQCTGSNQTSPSLEPIPMRTCIRRSGTYFNDQEFFAFGAYENSAKTQFQLAFFTGTECDRAHLSMATAPIAYGRCGVEMFWINSIDQDDIVDHGIRILLIQGLYVEKVTSSRPPGDVYRPSSGVPVFLVLLLVLLGVCSCIGCVAYKVVRKRRLCQHPSVEVDDCCDPHEHHTIHPVPHPHPHHHHHHVIHPAPHHHHHPNPCDPHHYQAVQPLLHHYHHQGHHQ